MGNSCAFFSFSFKFCLKKSSLNPFFLTIQIFQKTHFNGSYQHQHFSTLQIMPCKTYRFSFEESFFIFFLKNFLKTHFYESFHLVPFHQLNSFKFASNGLQKLTGICIFYFLILGNQVISLKVIVLFSQLFTIEQFKPISQHNQMRHGGRAPKQLMLLRKCFITDILRPSRFSR